MNQPFYEFSIQDDAQTFDFESTGKHIIKKKILYQNTSRKPFYNLALVDVLEDGSFDDKVESRNGDMDKILATSQTHYQYFSSKTQMQSFYLKVVMKEEPDYTKS